MSNSRKKGAFKVPYPNINAERSRAGMTVEDLAKSLGVTRKTVYNWMAHGNIPQSKLVHCSFFYHFHFFISFLCFGMYLICFILSAVKKRPKPLKT